MGIKKLKKIIIFMSFIFLAAACSDNKPEKEQDIKTADSKNDAKEELGREVKNLAAELAEKIIKEKVDDAQEISLIDKFIAEVGEDKWLNHK